MYCKKCNIEVHGNDHGMCPVCNGPLNQTSELSHAASGNAIDWQKLKDLISDIDAPAKLTEKPATGKEQEAPFELEKSLSTEDARLQNMAAVSAEPVEQSASDFAHTKEILDKALKEFDPEPALQPVLNQNPKYGAINTIFIVFALLIVAGVLAGYYFYFKEPEPAKRVSQAQADNKIQILKPTVPVQKAADGRQLEHSQEDATQPMAEPAALPASQTAAQPAGKEKTPSAAIKENKPAQTAPDLVSIEEKPAQASAEERKVIAPPQQKDAVNAIIYCVNVASCRLKESAEAVIKDLQKKGYEPELDIVTAKDITWYRVTLGHFQTQGEAQNYARKLQGRENVTGFVVKKAGERRSRKTTMVSPDI
jgi:hypothetical protein